jgi:hypothetical protein
MSSKRLSQEEALEQALHAHREAGYITHEVASLLKAAVAGVPNAEAYVAALFARGTITEWDERNLRLLIETSSAG